MEDEVGVKLFIRNKRYVNVTKNGQAFYQKIRPLLNNYYSAVQDIQKIDLRENSQITLGYSYTPFNDHYIPIWIKQFQKFHPKVKFVVVDLNRNELKQQLLSAELDLMITTGKEATDLSGVKKYLVNRENFKALVPRDNPLSKRTRLKLTDFQGEKLLFLDNNWAAVDLINLQRTIMHLNSQVNVTYANDLSSLNILIKSGQGITLGLYCIYAELGNGLTYVPIDWEPTVDLTIITPENNHKR
ncbi:LysR family transcriptional regulator, partial [Lactobacillus sp. XV13L]|nr:LysR family transcriptional regulator [Lactobacillus sp. XV13L]